MSKDSDANKARYDKLEADLKSVSEYVYQDDIKAKLHAAVIAIAALRKEAKVDPAPEVKNPEPSAAERDIPLAGQDKPGGKVTSAQGRDFGIGNPVDVVPTVGPDGQKAKDNK